MSRSVIDFNTEGSVFFILSKGFEKTVTGYGDRPS